MLLYDYFRSSASFRVRIALNLKAMAYSTTEVSLTAHEHAQADYLAINPQALVPALEDKGALISQSLAILDYLEDIAPHPPLLPKEAIARAQVRSIALYIACEMHPLNNLRTREHLKDTYDFDEHAIRAWCHHWLYTGFQHLEQQLKHTSTGQVCFGSQPTLADVCLVPQVYAALRFEYPIEQHPLIQSIHAHCMTIDAFKRASAQHPMHQA